MARYRLLAQHFSEEDKLLEPGTEVGDGCEHAWTRAPTSDMEPLDADAAILLDRERQRVGEPPVAGPDLPMAEAQPRRRQKRPPEPEPAAPPD